MSVKLLMLSSALSVILAITPSVPVAFAATDAQVPAQEENQSNAAKSTEEKKKQEGETQLSAEDLAEIEPSVGPAAALGLGNILVGGGAAAAAAGGAAALGGGGGAAPAPAPDPGLNPNPGPPAPPAPNPNPQPQPQPSEADLSLGLPLINAQSAYARGYTGDGVNVGIIDSGIFTSHLDLDSKVQDCFKASTGETGCEKVEVDAHGTHVAGIVAAEKNNLGMHGVAYDADLYHADIFVFDQNNQKVAGVSLDRQADAYNWITGQNVAVINNSYGFLGTHLAYTPQQYDATFGIGTQIGQAYRNAVANDVISVWAAGNSGAAEPQPLAALPLYVPELADLWVSVVSVSNNGGALASYSNACGQAANFCIAAPGGEFNGAQADGGILSTYINDGFYLYAAGTSMAAPHVTGGLAVMLDAFGPGTPSNLTPEKIVDIMFATANKSGIYADAALYGQGLLDLDAATRPDAATLSFATGGTFQIGAMVAETNLAFGPAFGSAPQNALTALSAGAHDQYGRIFSIPLADVVSCAPHAMDSKKLLGNFDARRMENIALGQGAMLQLAFARDSFSSPAFSENGEASPAIPQAFSLTADVSDMVGFSAHYGFMPGSVFGLSSGGTMDSSLLQANEQSLTPYLDFAGETAFSAGASVSLTKRWFLEALAYGNSESAPNLYEDDLDFDSVRGAATQITYQADNFTVSLIGGALTEDQQILGLQSSGAFDTDDRTNTYFAGMNLHLPVTNKISLIGSWQTGWTKAEEGQDSLFTTMSDIVSDSFTIGVKGQDQIRPGDEWGLVLHQPLRVTQASANLALPEGRSDSGAVVQSVHSVDLAPQGRELNLQLFYDADLTEASNLSAGISYRYQPGHDRNANDEAVGLIRYSLAF